MILTRKDGNCAASQIFHSPDRRGDISHGGDFKTRKDAFCRPPLLLILLVCEAPRGRQAAPQEEERATHRRLHASQFRRIQFWMVYILWCANSALITSSSHRTVKLVKFNLMSENLYFLHFKIAAFRTLDQILLHTEHTCTSYQYFHSPESAGEPQARRRVPLNAAVRRGTQVQRLRG